MPYRANFIGLVTHVQERSISGQGNEVQGLVIVDRCGKFVRCVAMGRYAGTSALESNTEVLIFFGSAKSDTSTQLKNGSIWLYNESQIIILRQNVAAAKPRTEIKLQP